AAGDAAALGGGAAGGGGGGKQGRRRDAEGADRHGAAAVRGGKRRQRCVEASGMEDIVVFDGVSKRFPGFTLDRVSFSVKRGYVHGFIGRNGAGKTTTIKLLMNLLRPDAGSIRVFGLDHRQHERNQTTHRLCLRRQLLLRRLVGGGDEAHRRR